MLYYIYIGNNRIIIDHLSKITGGMFVAVSSSQKAAKVIDGIRERYNISILYEQTDVREADCIEIVIYVNVIPGFISLLLLKH